MTKAKLYNIATVLQTEISSLEYELTVVSEPKDENMIKEIITKIDEAIDLCHKMKSGL